MDDGLDKLIKDKGVQIEIIGEDGGWTVIVSTREWSNDLQRYVYDEIGGCTDPSFLGAYDFMAQIVSRNRTETNQEEAEAPICQCLR